MIFHYDPLNYYIESDEDDNLIYTCVRKDRASPRIRYMLGDEGKVMQVSKLKTLLYENNITLRDSEGNNVTNRTNLPIIFVWGRVGTAVTYNGSKVAPENLEQALHSLNISTENYGFSSFEDLEGNRHLQILIETAKDFEGDKIEQNELRDAILDMLSEVNQDFSFQLDKAKSENLALPELLLFDYQTGPMANQDPHRKKQYIFDKNFSEIF